MSNSDRKKIEITIVVVPRESFSLFPQVVRQVYEVTSPIFKMIVMEGRSPEPIREQLLEIERTLPSCQVVLADKWQYPPDIVNAAIPLIDTEFVVFLDNDVELLKGSIEALVDCAREHCVSCVHPVYLGTSFSHPEPVIHGAQGKIDWEQRNCGRYLNEVMCGKGKRLEEYPLSSPIPSDYFEWHCVLFRKSLLDRIGPLDNFNVYAHIDCSLHVTELGEPILLEPRAIVAYDIMGIDALRGQDREYLIYRWDLQMAGRSLQHFREKWGLAPDATDRKFDWAKRRYERVLLA